MKPFVFIFFVSILSGAVVGRIGGRYFESGEAEMTTKAAPRDFKQTSGGAGMREQEGVEISRLVTSDDLDSIAAQGNNVSYASLALWLLEADGEEIPDYWRGLGANQPITDKTRLLFFHWTRVDPQGALAATAGTEDARLVFWAWAASDPAEALAAARTPEDWKRVAKGLGEFQPDWLMEHFDEIPEEARTNALEGMTTWKEADDAVAMLDFLEEKGRGFQPHIFKAFVLKDPWAAYDWLEKKGMLKLSPYPNGGFEILLRELKANSPDDLERMAATMPAGEMKRAMEDAVFERLVEIDPDRALENAMKTEAPLVAANRMAMIASGLLESDPEKAFHIAADILAKAPDGLSFIERLSVGTYSTNSGSDDGVAKELFDRLIAGYPERTLDLAVASAGENPGHTFDGLAASWARADLPSYAEWVSRQTVPGIRTPAIANVVMALAAAGNFSEAGEWAVTAPDPELSLNALAWRWGARNPEEARAWFQTADIPEKLRKRSLENIRNP